MSREIPMRYDYHLNVIADHVEKLRRVASNEKPDNMTPIQKIVSHLSDALDQFYKLDPSVHTTDLHKKLVDLLNEAKSAERMFGKIVIKPKCRFDLNRYLADAMDVNVNIISRLTNACDDVIHDIPCDQIDCVVHAIIRKIDSLTYRPFPTLREKLECVLSFYVPEPKKDPDRPKGKTVLVKDSALYDIAAVLYILDTDNSVSYGSLFKTFEDAREHGALQNGFPIDLMIGNNEAGAMLWYIQKFYNYEAEHSDGNCVGILRALHKTAKRYFEEVFSKQSGYSYFRFEQLFTDVEADIYFSKVHNEDPDKPGVSY